MSMNRILLLFKSTNQTFYFPTTSTICLSSNYTTRKLLCSSSEKTTSVEESLISIFKKRPICSESPELQEFSSRLTPKVVETVLKSFRDWRPAQVFFQWASNQRGYTHSCYVYNAMAAILSGARQNAPLRELALDLRNSPCSWTPGAFGYFLRCLGSRGLVEEANALFDQVRMSGLCVLNGYSYNCLLEVIAKTGDVGLLEYRLNEMRNLGCPIDKHALTPALQCYCNAGQFVKAVMVFNDLNDRGWVDQHILAILVLSYSKCGDVDKAFELIEWSERNLNISLNEKTLCILVHGFVREDRVDKALQLYDKMKKLGLLPDVSIYYVLIRGLCKIKAIEQALVLYRYMRQSGIPPDVQIISQLLLCIPEERDMIQLLEDTLIDLDSGRRMLVCSSILTNLVNGGYADKAYCLLKACTGYGMNGNRLEDTISLIKIKPDTTCFQTVIDGLCKADKLDLALDLFHSMDRSGCRRSVLLFNNLILCLSNADKLNECFDLLNEMKESGFQPTHFTFNCILGCLCRQVDVAGALDLLREMRACGHEPWIKTYTLLVKKLCEHGKVDAAYNFLTDMSKEGFLPDMIAYSATIDGFLNVNELDRGMKLFREICGRGYCPDIVAYNTIIKGLCKAKRIREAEDILNEMEKKDMLPDAYIYQALVDAFASDSDMAMAHKVLEKMPKRSSAA